MSKCPVDYKWVKVPRNLMPPKCKGLMKDYFKIAYQTAYKDGTVKYCGYENEVKAKQLVCGPAGLKRLLERRSRDIALDALFLLQDFELVTSFFEVGAKITIDVPDLILPQTCSIRENLKLETDKYIAEHYNELAEGEILNLQRAAIEFNEKCYVSDNSGYICVPRNLTERLVERKYVFDDADAFFDLYLHTVHNYASNPFSKECPCIQYEKGSIILTLDILCKRWNWSLSKVSRFLKKYNDYFSLVKLQSSYGCVIFSKVFQTGSENIVPSQERCFEIVNEFKNLGEYFGCYDEVVRNPESNYSQHQYVNCCIDSFNGFDPEEQAYKMQQLIANDSSLYETDNNESGTCSFNACGDKLTQVKVHTFHNIIPQKSSLISDFIFDSKNRVLQFLTYNNTFVDIKNFYYLFNCSNKSLSNLMVSSNNTLNKWACPKSWTAEEKGYLPNPLDYTFIRPPVTALATPVHTIFEPCACLCSCVSSRNDLTTPLSQLHTAPINENSSKKSLKSLISQTFATLKSKIKYLVKGVTEK